MELKAGEKYTLLTINWMALTSKKEIEIVEVADNPIYKINPAGLKKRKEKDARYILKFDEERRKYDTAIIPGWGLPFMTDFEAVEKGKATVFKGNAMINVIGDRNVLREQFDKNVNEFFDKSRVNWVKDPNDSNHKNAEELLYPEAKQND